MPNLEKTHNESILDWRANRQSIIASNIANADTPGFKAKDLKFQSVMSGATLSPSHTNPKHMSLIGSATTSGGILVYKNPSQGSVDGNTVETEMEAAAFADNGIKFEASLKAVSHDLKILRSAIESNP